MSNASKIPVLSKQPKGKGFIPQTFHYCCIDLITFAQCLGLFPVSDIRCADTKKLKFKWLSFKMLYTVLLLVLNTLLSITSVYKVLKNETGFYNLVAPLFHAQVTGTLLLFIKLSREWPKFLNKISSIDECFVKRYKSSTNLRRKIYVLAVSAYALVNVLHLLAMVKFQIMKDCHNSFTGFKYYIKKHFHYVFDLIPYNTITGVILLASSFVGLYIWTYGDIFIASTSMILTTRFHEIRERIYIYTRAMSTRERRLLKVLPKDIQKLDLLFWKEIRRDYNMMSKLCRKLNSLISNVILLDYASNLILILFQLFTGLGRKYTFPEMMYFYFSFGYMTLRISLLSAFGGWLYEAGRASIHILNMVPTEIYNNEISKLIHQMHNCTPCFTGKGFFRITKGLTLNIAAAIITYELVLVQFNQTKGNSDHVNQSACK